MKSYVKTKRLLRRNKATIIISCCILIALGIIGNSMYKTTQDNYTSKGLTSTQTLEGFYWGINNKDTVVVGDFSRGKEMRGYSDSISQIYVISKQRQSYYQDQGFQTMEEWLFWSTTPEKERVTGTKPTNTNNNVKPKASNLAHLNFDINRFVTASIIDIVEVRVASNSKQ